MTALEFRDLWHRAVEGDWDAVEQILILYMPLINRYSMIDGHLDEDCRQYILIRITLSISKFII